MVKASYCGNSSVHWFEPSFSKKLFFKDFRANAYTVQLTFSYNSLVHNPSHINLPRFITVYVAKIIANTIDNTLAITINVPLKWVNCGLKLWLKLNFKLHFLSTIGIQIRNMKMVFNIYCTWHWMTFEKLMMKIYDFFFIRLSCLVTHCVRF